MTERNTAAPGGKVRAQVPGLPGQQGFAVERIEAGPPGASLPLAARRPT